MPEVGDWSVTKYRLLSAYAQVFATSMKAKWDERVYLDLFAGAGKARTPSKVVLSSALLALGIRDPFNRYIFCDRDANCIEALQKRVQLAAPDATVRYVTTEINSSVEQLTSQMPRASSQHTVLTFCFVDPFGLSDLHFRTIQQLSRYRMDFLIHLPAMDPRRNEALYHRSNEIVDLFLGDEKWRADWEKNKTTYPFDYFVAEQFAARMRGLGYSFTSIPESVLVRSTVKNLRLYRLALCTKHPLAARFWKEIKKCTEDQHMLSF
jgi:three-Cys-motif partner protein